MAKDVWVIVEHEQGEVDRVTFELMDDGRKIATRLQSELVALVLGHQLPDMASILASYGADVVYLVDHYLLAQYTTDAYTCALAGLIAERSPFLVLGAATANGRDLAPRMAARLGMGLASDCVMVQLNPQGSIEAVRPTHCDKVYTTVVLTSCPPTLVTLRPGAVGVGKPDLARRARVELVSVKIDSSSLWTISSRTIKSHPSSIDISEAEIVVSGGRGLSKTETWQLAEELAHALGGCVAGSRMALDAGWISRERMVGQTGRTISPKVYFALGISGAREHLAGIRETENVVAINNDARAPILGSAHKGVVGDLNEVVPILIRKLKQLQQAEIRRRVNSGERGGA